MSFATTTTATSSTAAAAAAAMTEFQKLEPPLPVRRHAKGLSQRQLIEELAQHGRNPTGFIYDDIEELQTLFDAQFDVMKLEHEAWLQAERQAGIDAMLAKQQERALHRDRLRIEAELRDQPDVAKWTQLLLQGKCAKAAMFNSRSPVVALHIARTIPPASVLTSLALARCKIDDRVAAAVADMLRGNRSLRLLQMSSNKIGAAGLRALAGALRDNATLQTLYLSHNPLTRSSGRLPVASSSGGGSGPGRPAAAPSDLTVANVRNSVGGDGGGPPSTPTASSSSSSSLRLPGLKPSATSRTSPTRQLPDNPALDYSGVEALCGALRTNRTLQVLHVQSAELDGAAAALLVVALDRNSTLVVLQMDTAELSVGLLADLHRCVSENNRQRASRKAEEHQQRLRNCKAALVERLERERQRKIRDEAEWARRNRIGRLQDRQAYQERAALEAAVRRRVDADAAAAASGRSGIGDGGGGGAKKKKKTKAQQGAGGGRRPTSGAEVGRGVRGKGANGDGRTVKRDGKLASKKTMGDAPRRRQW